MAPACCIYCQPFLKVLFSICSHPLQALNPHSFFWIQPMWKKPNLPLERTQSHTHTAYISSCYWFVFVSQSQYNNHGGHGSPRSQARVYLLVCCHAHWAAHCRSITLGYTDVSVPHRLTGACTQDSKYSALLLMLFRQQHPFKHTSTRKQPSHCASLMWLCVKEAVYLCEATSRLRTQLDAFQTGDVTDSSSYQRPE